MGQYVSWLVNAGLVVLCCFLVANTANAVFDALLTPAVAQSSDGAPEAPPVARPWSDRKVILSRNLFNSSLLAPPPPAPKEVRKELEATKLPLSLLGTAASPNPSLSWAAVEDQSSRRTLVVRVDDEIQNKAKVTRIERKRIVLSENGVLRELVLSEPKKKPSKRSSTAKNRKRAGRSRGSRSARIPQPTPERPTATAPALNRNAASFFSDARILPKYVDGALVGMQVNTVKPGSPFELAGVREGEIITRVNGIDIDSPEKTVQIMAEISAGTQLTIEVDREEGPTTLSVILPEAE